MYKLTIIDDEKEQVSGIKTLTDWSKYDIEICGTAYDGKAGLELIQKEKPDIAIIDIRMPIMNGIELIKEVNKKNIKMENIILSGYDDFYYAQQAIILNTSNYLLKPCRPEEILQSVLKAKNSIIEENKKDKLLTTYKELITKNLPILKEKFLRELIKGSIKDESVINKKIKDYNLRFSLNSVNYYGVILFSYDHTYHSDNTNNNRNIDLLNITVKELIEQSLLEEYTLEIVFLNNDLIIILETENIKKYEDHLVNKLKVIKEIINDNLELSLTIGIGEFVPSLSLIWKSYKQAETAVETRFFSGENKIVKYNKKMSEENNNFLYPIQEEHDIIQCLELGDSSKAKKSIQSFFNNINIKEELSKKYVQRISITLLSNILHFFVNRNIEFDLIGLDILKTFDKIYQANTIDQIQENFISVINKTIEKLKSNKNINNTIKYVIDYIHNNYQDNINLQKIAEQVNYSPSYLSLLFKQETGTNFTDYLNQYRIKKAKELLKDMSIKNYEVAYKVGYQDEKYFYQVFKRYTGLTASQYRESIKISF